MNKLFFTLIIAASIILPKAGLAITVWPKTEQDWGLLPPFCKARASGGKSQSYQTWERKLGGDFLHIHHYCAAMHTVNIAHHSTDKNEIVEALKSAIGEIEYVEHNSKSNFRLLPHIFKTKADIFLELQNTQQAVAYLNKAIQLNPKFVPAYTRLADIYYDQNQKDQALEIVNRGLQIKPNSRALNKRLKKLRPEQ